MRSWSRLLTSIVICLFASWAVAGNEQFGIHVHHPERLTWIDIGSAWWRLWDTRDTWANVQPTKGQFDWHSLDEHVNWAEKHRLQLVYVLGNTPSWASSRPAESSAFNLGNAAPPGHMDDWRQYVRSVATRYRGRIKYFEVWNEPDFPKFFSSDSASYVALLVEAAKQIKAIDPEAKILAPATTGIADLNFVQEVLRTAGNTIDIVTLHGYTPNVDRGKPWLPPEALGDRLVELKRIMRRYAVGKPIWNSETGYPVSEMARIAGKEKSDTTMATYLVRSIAVNFAFGVEKVFWYAWDNSFHGSMLLAGLRPIAVPLSGRTRYLRG